VNHERNEKDEKQDSQKTFRLFRAFRGSSSHSNKKPRINRIARIIGYPLDLIDPWFKSQSAVGVLLLVRADFRGVGLGVGAEVAQAD
jgi:hypothetical protein